MKLHADIDDKLREFIARQPMFFVATAPADGHVNVSPKGMIGTFAVLDPLRVAYLDFHGSGAETMAHLRENGRITLMFCAFDGPPNIVRLYGTGRAIPITDPSFAEMLVHFPAPPDLHGARSIIDVRVHRVSDSCGYSVPLMDYAGDRDLLLKWGARKDADALADYRKLKNAQSIDGLPAFDRDVDLGE
jgi:hypothetical protein